MSFRDTLAFNELPESVDGIEDYVLRCTHIQSGLTNLKFVSDGRDMFHVAQPPYLDWEDQILGFVGGHDREDKSYTIAWTGVQRDSQGFGLGKMLVKVGLMLAREAECNTVLLSGVLNSGLKLWLGLESVPHNFWQALPSRIHGLRAWYDVLPANEGKLDKIEQLSETHPHLGFRLFARWVKSIPDEGLNNLFFDVAERFCCGREMLLFPSMVLENSLGRTPRFQPVHRGSRYYNIAKSLARTDEMYGKLGL